MYEKLQYKRMEIPSPNWMQYENIILFLPQP